MLDFSDPAKWVIQRGVPVLDEHELTDQRGQPEGFVDANILREIAANNNRRVAETGDAAPLIVGHTEDGVNAQERPVVGYAINYRVRPFRSGRQAIYCDFAVRRKYAHVLEDFPRRSVELWLSKKEIDPIALLGGNCPERDLGVIIRKSRASEVAKRYTREQLATAKHEMHFQAVALLGSTAPARDLGVVLKYSRHSGGNVLQYAMEDDKVGKVMSEYKHGTLHSGSKRGPKVTSRDQAVAIAMNEAGKSKHARGEDCNMPGEPMQYEDDEMETDDDGAGNGFGPSAQDEEDDDDPVVAKVLASKPMRDLMDKVNQIFDAVTGGAEGAPGGDGMGMPEGEGGAPPMEGAPPMGGSAPPMGAGGPPGGGPPMEEDAAMFHNPPPVRFEDDGEEAMDYSATGFGGPASTSVPGFNGAGSTGKRGKPFSRNGSTSMNGTQQRPSKGAQAPKPDEQVVRLSRTVRELSLKLARADAEKAISALKTEGVVFGDTPDEAKKNEEEEVRFLAALDAEGQKWHLQRVRKLYKRRDTSPADGGDAQLAELMKYSRPQVDTGDPNDFTPSSPQEAAMYADLQTQRGMSPVDAVKYMRAAKGRR